MQARGACDRRFKSGLSDKGKPMVTNGILDNWIEVSKRIFERYGTLTFDEFYEEFGDCESHAYDMIEILIDEGFIVEVGYEVYELAGM